MDPNPTTPDPKPAARTPPHEAVPTDARTVRAALDGFVRLTEVWSLTDRDAARLLELAAPAWLRIRSGERKAASLTPDQLLRIGLLAGIYRDLPRCFGPEIARTWPTLPNRSAPFEGRTPVAYLIDGAMPAFVDVRQRVESMGQGA